MLLTLKTFSKSEFIVQYLTWWRMPWADKGEQGGMREKRRLQAHLCITLITTFWLSMLLYSVRVFPKYEKQNTNFNFVELFKFISYSQNCQHDKSSQWWSTSSTSSCNKRNCHRMCTMDNCDWLQTNNSSECCRSRDTQAKSRSLIRRSVRKSVTGLRKEKKKVYPDDTTPSTE